MGVRLVRHAALDQDPGRQPRVRYASVNGRQFYVMAADWPEVAEGSRITGIYQAIGREKLQTMAQGQAVLEESGGSFDVFRPASLIFEYLPLGPMVTVAIAFGCGGPFVALEGDELAGPTAVAAALDDLAAGRCDQALVGGYVFQAPRSRLLLLSPTEAPGLRWVTRYGSSPEGLLAEAEQVLGVALTLAAPDETDPHGLSAMVSALEAAQAGRPTAVWRCTDDGRGMLVGLALE